MRVCHKASSVLALCATRPVNDWRKLPGAMGAQRISYVPVEQMDSEMRAEMERCRR